MNTREGLKKSHRQRDDLTGEYRWGDAGQGVLLALFLVVWIADSVIFHWATFPAVWIPPVFRIVLALCIYIFAGYFAIQAHNIVFKTERAEPRVIREGIFRVVRHPIYLGAILFYLGAIVLTASVASFVLWIGIVLFYHMIARYEEGLLRDRFGSDYAAYQSDVPMWIPRIGSAKNIVG